MKLTVEWDNGDTELLLEGTAVFNINISKAGEVVVQADGFAFGTSEVVAILEEDEWTKFTWEK